MRIVGVPMIDRDPIKLGPEVALCLGHEIAREGADVLHRSSVLGRDDEAEMVAVVFAGRSESPLVGGIAVAVEHGRITPVSGDALALQIVNVLRQRRRPEPLSAMADDPRLDDDAPLCA